MQPEIPPPELMGKVNYGIKENNALDEIRMPSI
jgi:hypothetical protein